MLPKPLVFKPPTQVATKVRNYFLLLGAEVFNARNHTSVLPISIQVFMLKLRGCMEHEICAVLGFYVA
jgi:hypothetical protein